MTEQEKDAVIELAAGKASQEDILNLFSTSPDKTDHLVLRLLNETFSEKDPDGIECALILGFTFGFSQNHVAILCSILDSDWHHSHEDSVTALDGLRASEAIEPLFRATLIRHDYLEFDQSRALAIKAIYALSHINDPAASEKLRVLAASNDPIVANKAKQRLMAIGGSAE